MPSQTQQQVTAKRAVAFPPCWVPLSLPPLKRIVSTFGQKTGLANTDSPFMSADGKFIPLSRGQSKLVPNDTNNAKDIFIMQRSLAGWRVATSGSKGECSGWGLGNVIGQCDS